MKKICALFLTVSMTVSMLGNVVYAEENPKTMTQKDVIIQEYREALLQNAFASNGAVAVCSENGDDEVTTTAQIQTNTVQALVEAGYEAYDVTSQSFDDIEEALNTDLEDMGLSPEGSYIILIEGEEGVSPQMARSTDSSIGSSFAYAYDGVSYVCRWATVYPTAISNLRTTSSADLVKSASGEILKM